MTITPTTVLTGSLVRLEPLTAVHAPGLAAAAAEDRSSYGWTSVPAGESEAVRYVDQLTAEASAGSAVPFAQVRVADGAVVGSTRFLHLRPYAVEIGGTWLARSAQRTGINREAKLLLLTRAFEEWGMARVDLCTDARNETSRRAIAGLGAAFEGVLRGWQLSRVVGEEGQVRDTAMFSIVRPEWPGVRAGLTAAP
ncbi:MAG: acetyltransferase [Frankiales bacterium]|nr:acetyltransferase [Frankiales bacterium]